MADPEQLQELTVDELSERAKQAGVTGYSSMRKDELVQAVAEAEDGRGGGDASQREGEAGGSRGHDRGHAARGEESGLGAGQVAQAAMAQLAALTGKPIMGVLELEPVEDGWRVVVEIAELRRIPDSSDVLASYETTLDANGELRGYRRVRRYIRAQPDEF